jgi:hypothetical protein
MPENLSKRYKEELEKFREKQKAVRAERSNSPNTPGSRYLEYRKFEQLKIDQMEHPEKYIPVQPKIDVTPEPSPIIPETPIKKKSWFSKLFEKD